MTVILNELILITYTCTEKRQNNAKCLYHVLLFSSAVIDWLRVPDTQFMLDQVRPDFLMLRVSMSMKLLVDIVPVAIGKVPEAILSSVLRCCIKQILRHIL